MPRIKTLGAIIEEVRDGGHPEYEDLRYAVCALGALGTFDRMAFMKLASAERDGKKPFITTSPQWQWEEHFRRTQAAMNKPPKEYVGWSNDPDNPEFLARRKVSQKILDAAARRAERK